MNRRQTTRRTFMKGAAAAAGAGFFVWNQRSYAESRSPSEQLNIAWIGVGGKGKSDLEQASTVGRIIAICDTDENIIGERAEKFDEAEQFVDFREMLDKLGDKIDAVGISTPDHTHYPAAMLAMKKGKHVYCQKPLTWSVWEARMLREAAAKYNVKTQMGNQGMAMDNLRKGVEWVRSGVIGDVTEVHVWTNRPIWPQAPVIMQRPPEAKPPESLHWDLWLGPAPQRPYARGEIDGKEYKPYHSFNWRGWWDFGTGALGDMACHTANLPFLSLKLKYPTSVQAEAGDLNPETFPSWARIMLEYPERDGMPPVKFHWYEGRMFGHLVQPDKAMFTGFTFGGDKTKFPPSGALMIGSKGKLYQPGDQPDEWVLLPEKDFANVKGPEQSIPRVSGDSADHAMKKEWAASIRGELEQPFSNFGYAGVLTEAVLLGNSAIRHRGQRLEWDGEAMKFNNNEDANKTLRRDPRSGWDVTL